MHSQFTFAAPIESLVMPGKVIEGHAKLEQNCSNCHEKFDRKKQRTRCIECHKKIRHDINKREGYHGKSTKISNQECNSCHTEHKGRKADIIKLNQYTFDHHLTDFKLTGQHTKTACNSCHVPKKSYRDTAKDCYSCHRKSNPHNHLNMKKYTRRCATCHTTTDWRNTQYDHNQTKFKLVGKHKKTPCINCHIADHYEKTLKQCISCHQTDDVHRNANGPKCDKCHNPNGWKKMRFDHAKDTDFPLRARHAELTCQSCHKNDPYREKIKSTCISCHRHDDKHKGNFGTRCQSCHTEERWSRYKFNHDKDTKFRLLGKHKQTDCTSCHKVNIYKNKTPVDCYACHRVDDVHKGGQGKNCKKCHNEKGWRQNLRFDHDLSSFPLIGLHAVVPCEECHLTDNYKGTSKKCNSCHKKDDIHEGKLGVSCQDCHSPNSWKIWRFDHNTQSKFKLEDGHANLHCHSCHISAVEKIDSEPRSCINCHRRDDEHNGQFGAHCDRCHTTRSFKDLQMRR